MSDENEEQKNTQDLQLLLDELLDAERLGLDDVSASEAYVNSCEECAQKQKDELDVLSAVYGDDFTLLPSQEGGDTMIDIKIRNLFVENSHSFTFSVNIPETYPNVPPLFDIHALNGFKRDYIDRLWQSIIEIGENKIGQPMLYDMTSYCQEYIANLQTQPKEESPAKVPEVLPKVEIVEEKPEIYWEEKRVFTSVEFRSNFRYSDLFSEIRKFESTEYRVVRVENIRNVHREALFDQRFSGRNKIKPIWVWHGTSMRNIPSIIARGLLPAGNSNVKMEHGNAYGNGIYLAKDPTLSLGYSETIQEKAVRRLLLCALFRKQSSCISEYDWGYVCADGGVILPSYAVDVILDREAYFTRRQQATQAEPELHKLMETDFSDLKGKEKMEKMKAYAARHLPFGYGGASGDAFTVLEVAPHDDDDDDTTYSEQLYNEEHYDETPCSEYSTEINMTTSEFEKAYVHDRTEERISHKKKKAQKKARP
eukprot:Phypoly_transcript_05493.p1 GENE.Phypoly_transcript_05493~~Phypoly_transcript_05493.p1  ORF type:complete len:481 (+),score=72.72 Phypoly_transcript_05493:2-1444(+)